MKNIFGSDFFLMSWSMLLLSWKRVLITRPTKLPGWCYHELTKNAHIIGFGTIEKNVVKWIRLLRDSSEGGDVGVDQNHQCRFVNFGPIDLKFSLRESWDIVEMLFLGTFSKAFFEIFYFWEFLIFENKKLFWEIFLRKKYNFLKNFFEKVLKKRISTSQLSHKKIA